MVFSIIVIVLVLQFYLQLGMTASWRQNFWQQCWAGWQKCAAKIAVLSVPLYSAAAFLVIGLLIWWALLAVLGFVFSGFASFILSLGLMWLAVDVFPEILAENNLMYRYRRVFALWFWFAVLGSYGALAYMLLSLLSEQPEVNTDRRFQLVLAAADWIPARLLGMSFGLVGNLMPILRDWLATLRSLQPVAPLLERWSKVALSQASDNSEPDTQSSTAALLRRSVLLWLVVLAVLSIGAWI